MEVHFEFEFTSQKIYENQENRLGAYFPLETFKLKRYL